MYGYNIFHENLMQNLINTVHNGNSSHAYIFEGAEGLAVNEAARLFAAALTCRNSEIAPCGACPSCIEAKAFTNPDIAYPKPDKDRKTIGAENMRALEEDVSIKPFAAKRKVYIFEDASQLTEAAQNVFLKTLEEPPEYAVFIIITENAENLLQTIRSRAVTIHFPVTDDNTVREYISKKYPEVKERLEFLIKYCGGIPQKADSVIEDADFDRLRNESLDMLPALLSGKPIKAFELQKFTEANKDSMALILDFWSIFLRDVLLLQTGAADNLINVDKRDALKTVSSKTDPEMVVKKLDALAKAQKMTARYVSAKAVTYWLAL